MGSNKEYFCSNYMLLKPKEATVFDLICLLFSSNLYKRKFIDCPHGTKETLFQSRWVIFLSVFLLKFFALIEKPLAWIGWALEHSINLVSWNGSFIMVIFNFIRGKLIIPDEESASFESVAALSDPRLALDKHIKRGDSKFYPALSMMAAKVSYENKKYSESAVEYWKMEFLGSFDFLDAYRGKANTQAFLFRDKSEDSDVIVVSFRGTEPFSAEDWSTDADLSWYEITGVGKVHAGFMKALGLQKGSGWPKNIEQEEGKPGFAYYHIREMLRKLLKDNEEAKFIVTGHSLGGALAILFPAILMFHEETFLLDRLASIYTFGQPRVGNDKFGEFVMEKVKKYSIGYYRFVYCNDFAPRIPSDNAAFMYRHFGTCVYANTFYQTKIIDEIHNKNYFSILYYIPKVINAYWELLRSFLIGYVLGKEFRESYFLRFVRVIGLALPGVSNHMPQDYVNITRLGSLNYVHDVVIRGSSSSDYVLM